MTELLRRYASIRESRPDLPQSYASSYASRRSSLLARLGMIMKQRGMPVAVHCMLTCGELLRRHFGSCESAEDGALLAPLEGGYMLAVICGDASGSRTFETADKCFIVVLALDDVRSFYFITSALWGNRNFLPDIGDVSQLPPSATRGNLPPGFDNVVNELRADQTQKRVDSNHARAPRWTLQVQKKLIGIREFAARSTFEAAVHFVLLHEIAHVLHGHASVSGVEFSNPARSDYPPERDFPYWGVEIHADRWAGVELQNYSRSVAPKKTISENWAMVTFLGCVITFLLQHGKAELSAVPKARANWKHPPLWFRAFDLISQFIQAGGEFSCYEDQYYACLDGIARRDPLFGTWLHPIRDREPAAAAGKIVEESLAALNAWKEKSTLSVYAFRRQS